jgi:hypothetical protein
MLTKIAGTVIVEIIEISKNGFIKAAEKVRICIIKGIDKNNPYWYSVLIGPYKQPKVLHKHFVVMTRLHTMNAESHENLNHFLSSFSRAKRFWLAPGYSPENSFSVTPFLELGFMCSEITIRNAWEIGPNELDAVAIIPGSNPIIPNDITDAPVLETLKIKADRSEKP